MINYLLIVLTKFCFLANAKFIVPKEATDSLEIFQYQSDVEFIINNYPVTWNQADYICTHMLNGTLAYFENQGVTDFVAEYLGESDMSLNTLWVNIRKSSVHRGWTTWKDKIVDEKIFECPHHTPSNLCPNCTESRSCGAVVRMFHSEICFVKLQCDARRKFICRRSIMEMSKSTHLDWLRVGMKLYKIFYERLTYDEAAEACTMYDVKSKLALIETYTDAQQLGRYLLVGRPSKERVWIGAKWEFDGYEFEDGSVVLSNVTDSSGYPPWLRGQISKPSGCILLDRHLDGLTFFVETNCKRQHSYMCYKHYEAPTFVETCFVGNYDWRIYYTPQNWFQASETCQNSDPTGRLPYIEAQDLKSIIHVMETSKFDVLYHVWLGAYFENGVWTWTYNNIEFPQETIDGFPPWVVNKTHDPNIEKYNLCLNLDREDSLEAIFYGTNCYYPQFFICQYDKGSICSNATTSTKPTEKPTTKTTKPTPTTKPTETTKPTPTTKPTKTTKPTPTTKPTKTTKPTPTTKPTKTTKPTPTTKPTKTTKPTPTTKPTKTTKPTPTTKPTTTTRRTIPTKPTTKLTTTTRRTIPTKPTLQTNSSMETTKPTKPTIPTVGTETDPECIISDWPANRDLTYTTVQSDSKHRVG